MKKHSSSAWKSSSQARKQRKYRHNAPLHARHKFMGAHLSKEMRKKAGRRSIPVRVGDTVKVMRGSHEGKQGKVRSVNRTQESVFIENIDMTKKDGNKRLIPFHPSNLMIIALQEEKKRIKNNDKKSS